MKQDEKTSQEIWRSSKVYQKKKKMNEILPFATTWTELEGMYHT